MNDLQQQFVTDAEELVENLFRALQQLRVRQSVGRIRRQLTGQIFRQVHTLKGSAGAAERESISRLAHEFESVLDGVRLGRIRIDDAVLDTFEDAAHAISEMLHAPDGEPASASDALLVRLRTSNKAVFCSSLSRRQNRRALRLRKLAAACSQNCENRPRLPRWWR